MVYLLDYENTNEAGLSGVEKLSPHDSLLIFYNDSSKISIDYHKKLENSQCKTTYFKLNKSAKNALDFQLSTYLGYLIHEDSKELYSIISKDTGFDSVVTFWKGRQIKINRCTNIGNSVPEYSAAEVKLLLDQNNIDFVADIDELIKLMKKYKSKSGLNNSIMKIYSSEKTGRILSAIKPLIKDKK